MFVLSKLRYLLCVLLLCPALQGVAMSQGNPVVPENEATLRALVVTGSEVVPQFSPGRARVSAHVPHSITSAEVTAAATDPQAMVSVNGEPVVAGKAFSKMPLAVGRNMIPISVTARDGKTKRDYTVKILRDYAAPNWTQVLEKGPFPPRDSAGELVFNNQMWLLGGYLPKVSGDIWSSPDGTNWQQIGQLPSANGINIPVNFVHDGKMWVASNEGEFFSSPDGKEWKLVNAAPPWAKRYAAGSAVFKGRMWVFGGFRNGKWFNEIWSSADGVDWKQEVANAPWSPRQLFGNVVVKDGKLWVVGGGLTQYEPFRAYQDVWSSEDGVNWQQVTERAPFPARIWSSCVVYRDRIFLLGGFRAQPKWENLGDVWYSDDGKNWRQLQTETMWSARHEHSPSVFNGKLWVVAGNTWPLLNDVWSLDIAGLTFLSQPVIEDYVGTQYLYDAHADFQAGNSAVRYRLSKSPGWLKVNAETGTVSGVAPAAGDYEVVLEAFTTNGETARQSYILHIQSL